MVSFLFWLVLNLIEFSIKKKSFNQSLGQDHNFSVYETTFSIKTGENLRALSLFYRI